MTCSCNNTKIVHVTADQCGIAEAGKLGIAEMPAYLADECTIVRAKPNDMVRVPAFAPAAHVAEAYRRSAGGVLVTNSVEVAQSSGSLSLSAPAGVQIQTPALVVELNSAAIDKAGDITFDVDFQTSEGAARNSGSFRIQQKTSGRTMFILFFYDSPPGGKIAYPCLAHLGATHGLATIQASALGTNIPTADYVVTAPASTITLNYTGTTVGVELTLANLSPNDAVWLNAVGALLP